VAAAAVVAAARVAQPTLTGRLVLRLVLLPRAARVRVPVVRRRVLQRAVPVLVRVVRRRPLVRHAAVLRRRDVADVAAAVHPQLR